MKRTLFGILMISLFVIGPSTRREAKAQPAPLGATIEMWQPLGAKGAKSALGPSTLPVRDGFYEAFSLDEGLLEATLANAPVEFATVGKTEDYRMMLPMPDGTLQAFRIWESSIMEPALAAEFPQIKTYVAQGIDDPTATARLDRTPLGFHAQILSAARTVYVDPYRAGDTATYVSYEKRGLRTAGRQFQCFVDDVVGSVEDDLAEKSGGNGRVSVYSNGGTLRTYRLALACTGEYATAVCNHNGVSVTVANTMAAMTTSVNRVTGIYEREVSIRLVLVGNNSSIVFTNASTDPYTNTNPNSLLTQNQSTCDSTIGSANYDIGHVFSTGGGGLAGLGVVCSSSRKAQGETGSSAPYGDGYDVDYVAHEMGHQFGGNHTFISTQGSCSGNGNAGTAYERGSGSTIMAYAGICGTDDLQPHSDDYFHAISLNEITNYVAAGGNCSVNTGTGNTVPTLTIGSSYTGVPVGTPFTLTAQSASDANGDTLTYCWEDYQTGSANKYRPRPPTTSPSRTIPQLSDVLAGSNSTTWETTASQTTGSARTFRCTVRDNRAGGGAYTSGTMTVTFVAGAFSVSAPNTAVSWAGNSSQTVTWTKGGSTAANVKISLSTDGGTSWSTVVASTPNDGSEAITVPNTPSTTCRIKVEPTDNIYFDVSNVNFTITNGGTPTPDFSLSASPTSVSIAQGASAPSTITSAISGGFNSAVALSASGLPSGASAAFSPSSIAAPGSGSSTMTITVGASTAAGTYPITVTGTGGSLTRTTSVSLTVTTTGGGGVTPLNCGDAPAGSLATTDPRSTVKGSTFYADTYSFTPAASGSATITLNSSAFDCWLVLKSSATATTELAHDDDGNGGTNSKLVYTVTAGTTYYVEATSYAANATGAYTLTLSCPTGGGTVTLLSEGAESGAAGWTVTTNTTGNNWVLSANGRRTGANGFRTNQATTTYPNNLDQSLISPAFSLSGKTSATLGYYAKRDTESGYDFFRVEVSTNGGSTWTQLSSVSGTSTGFTQTAGSGMVSNTVSLTPYAGQANVQIRFRFTTDVSVVKWGVALDDITVTAQ